jgi:hypothetical protein
MGGLVFVGCRDGLEEECVSGGSEVQEARRVGCGMVDMSLDARTPGSSCWSVVRVSGVSMA